jgi:peptidoglycan/LPS O-acetylase OafA/YrhL
MSNVGCFGPNALTPTWSLAVEEQFYLIIPVIIYFTNRKQLATIAILCIVFAQYYRISSSNWFQEYTHFLSRMDAPFLGILLAIGREHNTTAFTFYKKWYTKLFLFLFCIVLYLYHHSFNHLLISFVFILLVEWSVDLKENSFMFRILTKKLILLIGKYSFFIYLFHQLINGIIFAIFQNISNPNLDTTYSYLLEIMSFGLTFILSHISFNLFESKLINFGQTVRYNTNSK